MITAIICLVLGGMLCLLVTRMPKVPSRTDILMSAAYCRQCGNAPGYQATARCYECEDYSEWVRKS